MLLTAAPVLVSVGHAGFENGRLTARHLVGVFNDAPRLLGLLTNTAAVTGLTLFVSLGIGVPLGLAVWRTDLLLRRLWAVAVVLGCCMPLYVTATCWLTVVDLRLWGVRLPAAGVLMGMAYVSVAALITGAGLRKVPASLEQLALLDAGPMRVVWSVTLRQGSWAIVAAGIVVAVLTMSDITVTDILLVRTFTEEVFAEFQLSRSLGPPAAVAVPVIVPAMALGLVALRLIAPLGEATEQDAAGDRMTFRLRRGRRIVTGMIVAAALGTVLPLAFLVRATRSVETVGRVLIDIREELTYSVMLGGLAAVLCAVLAWGPAWWVARRRCGNWLVYCWLVLLIVTPAPLIGMGLTALLNRPGVLGMVYDSPLILTLAYVVRFLSFAVLAILPAIRAVPRALEEDAALCGATRFQTFRYVLLPLSARMTAIGMFLVFVLSLGEIGATVLIAPPGPTTLTVHFFTLIHYGVYADAATICLTLATTVAVFGLIVFTLWPRVARR